MLYAISDGSDFLPHKNEVTDSKAEKSDGHERNQMRGDDVQALQKGKRTLESSQGKSLQGPIKIKDLVVFLIGSRMVEVASL